MCGIAGYFQSNGTAYSANEILAMIRSIAHRGPDDEGITLILPETGSFLDLATSESGSDVPCQQISRNGTFRHSIAFGHRRFSIIDISPAGHQPFWSRDKRVCLCFNGEIYNYVELREELARLGHQFVTQSDAEVLAEAYLQWDVECFSRLNGFWALSLYDAKRKALLLSRDRVGKAPLYIAQTPSGLYWGSEIKALWAALGRDFWPIREQAVSDFVLHGWRDLFHQTFYDGVSTFPNAAFAWVAPDGSYRPQKFWELPRHRLREREIGLTEAAQELRRRLTNAVRLRLRADVPVGLELSGGMDSSALVALAVQESCQIRAFTVSFPGTLADEAPFARRVVQRYPGRIHHSILHPPPDDFFRQADSYVWLLEEPFHSPNLRTNQGIWKDMNRAGIRVSINGAAGDETLAGYHEYYGLHLRSLCRLGHWTRFGKELFSSSEDSSSRLWSRILGAIRALPLRRSDESLRVRIGPSSPFNVPARLFTSSGPSLEICQRLVDDMGSWRMNYWMRSGNKSAMGVPIEVRFPFLDFQVLGFAFTLPISYLIRDGWLKWVLRESVKDLVPVDVVWRRNKMGFPFPYVEWLTSSRQLFLSMIDRLDCPYLDMKKLHASYSGLVQQDPLFLWRMISVALWWKRCVQGDTLS